MTPHFVCTKLRAICTKLLSALLLGGALLAGCGSKEERIERSLRKGAELVAAADFDKAGLEVRNVLQIDPKNAAAYFLSGQIDEGRQEVQRAYLAYTKTLELAPSHRPAQEALARIYLLAGDRANAQKLTTQLLAAEPQSVAARTLQAALLAEAGDSAAAQKLAEAVLASGGTESADTSLLLAGLYANNNNPARALQVVEKGLVALPNSLPLLQVAAQLASQMSTPASTSTSTITSNTSSTSTLDPTAAAAKAIAFYKRGTQIAPKTASYWNNWAAHHARRNEVDAAEAVLRDARVAQPDDSTRTTTWLDFLASRRGADVAIKAYQELISEKKNDGRLRLGLAELYRKERRRSDAERTWRELIASSSTSPDSLIARTQLAGSRLAAGEAAEANALLADVLAQSPRDGAALVLRSRIHMQEARLREAINDLRAASKDQPGSLEVTGLLAQAHRLAGEPQLARDVLAEAVKFKPQSTELRLLLAADWLDAKDYKAAITQIEQAIKNEPNNLAAYDLKVLAALAQKDMVGAEKVYTDLRQRLPNDPAPLLRLGRLYAEQKKPDAALKAYDAAMRLAPRASEPVLAAVTLLAAQRKFEPAAQRIDLLQRADPGSLLPLQMKGDLAMAQGKAAQAEADYRRLIERAPKLASGYILAARALFTQNQNDAALALLAQGQQANPQDPALSLARAEWLARLSRTEEAIKLYETLHQRDPLDDAVANNLAYLLSETRGDPASLQRALTLMARFATSNNASYLDSLGWVQHRLGRNEQALPLLERAVALAPQSALLQLHLGLALYKSGQQERGRQVLKKVVNSGAPLPQMDEAKRIVSQG